MQEQEEPGGGGCTHGSRRSLSTRTLTKCQAASFLVKQAGANNVSAESLGGRLKPLGFT